MRRQAVRFGICLSLANLLCLKSWALLNEQQVVRHFQVPPSTHWLGTVGVTLVLAGILFGAQSAARLLPGRWSGLVVRFGLLAIVLLILKRVNEINGIVKVRPVLEVAMKMGRLGELALAIVALSTAAVVLWLFARSDKPARLIGGVSLVLFPYFLVNSGLAGAALLAGDSSFQDLPPRIATSPQVPGPRVVWLVLDSLDFHYAFEDRPTWLKLPELDRLRRESIDFADALAPADRTEKSIPSLLTGLVVEDQHIPAANDFDLTLAGGVKSKFRGLPTIFQKAENMGARTAVLGLYLPYGRILGNQTTYCRWWQWGDYFDSQSSWLASLPTQIEFAAGKPVSVREQVSRQIRTHEQEMAAAGNLLACGDYRLVFLHLFPPHQPSMYDARNGRYDPNAYFRPDAYFDSLALADRDLGEIRRKMEAAGTYGETLFIVTSDHSWRYAGEFGKKVHFRIPFILHLPGQSAGVSLQGQVNTLCSYDLVLDYLSGKIRGVHQMEQWIWDWMKRAPRMPSGVDHVLKVDPESDG